MDVLSSSKLSKARMETVEGVSFWVMPRLGEIPKDTMDTYYEFKSNDRLDNLAYQFYNSPDYAWAIAHANGFYYENEIEPGTILRIPPFVNILLYMSGLKV